MLLPESTHALAVGLLLVVLFIGFVREWVKPDVAVLTAVALLLLTGLLTPAKVLGVFSNSAPFTIACLFIISGALSRTGCVDWLGERIAHAAQGSEFRLLVGLLLVGLVVSPFINNTPVVMVMIPVVIGLATRLSLSPSRLLIPLSYATILGGTVTLVGTSTNILVDGVARSMGLAPFSMFEISAPALLIALLGCGFMLLFARRWLPERETLMEEFASGTDRLDTPRQRDVVIVEALVGQTSRYVLRPIRDLDLASRYGIRLIAVHRKNVSMADMDDDFQLQFGDVLLVEGAPSQIQRFCDNGDLFAITERKPALQRRGKAPVAVGTMVGVMALAALDVMPIEGLALIGAVLVVLTGCLKPDEAYKSIEWPILMLIYGMLAVSVAMRDSGLSALAAQALVHWGGGLSPWLVLSLVILATSIATEFISNNAVAVLFTPVVIGVALELGVDPRPFVVGIMFAASFSFATPIGYQTNTLVYSAGNYRFSDFARLGVPMNLLTWAAASLLIPLFWPFQPG
jgi:di/tricarboxylate transporter